MIRAVLDASVIASGVLGIERDESTPGAILRAWYRRTFELVISDALIVEIERTLAGDYFAARLNTRLVTMAMASLRNDATRTALTTSVTGSASHSEDDLVLAAAVSAAVG